MRGAKPRRGSLLYNVTKNLINSLVALGSVFAVCSAALAADTHDYSTYVKLKNNVSVRADDSVGYPHADAWDPEGGMDNEHAYLIPSGKSITAYSNNGTPVTWPGIELAIQGAFAVSTSNGRNGAAIIPKTALLPGSRINLYTSLGTYRGTTIDIRGTAASPARIENTTAGDTRDMPQYYPLIDVAMTGDADAVVRFARTVETDGRDLQRAFRVTGGFADFEGTVVVSNSTTWLRDTSATTFDLGGTMRLEYGGGLYLDTLSPTFGGLTIAADSTLRLVGGKTLTVDGDVVLDDGARIVVDEIGSTAFVYNTTTVQPPTIPFLSVCGADHAAAVDRSALLAAVVAGGLNFSGTLGSGMPSLCIVESVRTDGGVDFAVSHTPIVQQTNNGTSSKTPYGLTDATSLGILSDKQLVSSEKDYACVARRLDMYFRGTMPYVFPGHSMTVNAANMCFYGGDSVTFDDLRVIDNLVVSATASDKVFVKNMAATGAAVLRGSAHLYGDWTFGNYGTFVFTLGSNLSGGGNLCLAVFSSGADGKSAAHTATFVLSGTNTAYVGHVSVGSTNFIASSVALAETNVTLRVAEGFNLGGDMAEPAFDAVRVGKACTLEVTDTAVFSAANRGWCLTDGSTVSVAADKIARVNETVSFGGTVTKKGAGRLVLGGAARFYDAANDASVETSNGAALTVAAGTLGFESTAALTGVTVSFATGTSLVVDLEATGDVKAKGLVGPAFADAVVPLSFAAPAEFPDEVTVAVCTVSSASKDTLSFAAPRRLDHRQVTIAPVENGDDTVTFLATLKKTGVILIVR